MRHPFTGATALVCALLAQPGAAATLTFQSALDRAVERSEATRAARAGALSAGEAAQAASQLPDPTLRVGVDNLPATGPDRFHTARDSMTMKRIGVSQEWLSREKRDLRRTAADAMTAREAVQARIAGAEVRLQTALAYLDAFYVDQALELTTLMEHHAHEEYAAARARLAAAAAGGDEVMKLAAARGMTEDESAELRQQQSTARVALERWVGAGTMALAPVDVGPLPTEADYVVNDPMVASLQGDIDVARGAAAVAASDRRPNWTWEVSYGQRTGYSDMVSVGVNIPLPVSPAERQDRETASKLALADKAEAQRAEATRAATAEYRALVSDVQHLRDRIAAFQSSVLAAARQRTAVATAAYGSNQTSSTALFEARRAEVDAQRKLLALERDLAKQQARLTYRPLSPEGRP